LYIPRIQSELRKQVQAYIDTQDMAAVNSQGMVKVVTALAYTSGVAWARYSNAYIKNQKKAAGQMGFNERIVQLMQAYYGADFLNVCENITNTTKYQIARVLETAAQEGWGIDKITAELKSPNLTAFRARLISRTETIAAANSAAVLNVRDLGYDFKKEWIAALDARTRKDHRELDGKKVGMMEPFKVVDQNNITQQLMQPGDKSLNASASQLCNCRCCVAFE
jgi:uncharacterized protein with gpF-like domain